MLSRRLSILVVVAGLALDAGCSLETAPLDARGQYLPLAGGELSGALAVHDNVSVTGSVDVATNISVAGRLGVGTDEPTAALDVSGTARFREGIRSGALTDLNNGRSAAVQSNLAFFSSSADGMVLSAAPSETDFLRFEDQNATVTEFAVRHDSVTDNTADVYVSGKVGIGIETPGTELAVQGDALFIGKVGVGEISPAHAFNVQGGASISAGQGTEAATLAFRDSAGVTVGDIQVTSASDPVPEDRRRLRISTNGQPNVLGKIELAPGDHNVAMTLQPNGRVDIANMLDVRTAVGAMAALAMCHHTEQNGTTDAQYIAVGRTGSQTCADFRAGSICREVHYVYYYDGGSAEGSSPGAAGCNVPADNPNHDLIGVWACCIR